MNISICEKDSFSSIPNGKDMNAQSSENLYVIKLNVIGILNENFPINMMYAMF